MPARRAALRLAAVVVLAVMVLVLLSPGPVDRPVYGTLLRAIHRLQEYGLPLWVQYSTVESAANVLLFVPLGFLAGALLGVRRWWLALLLCAGLSAGVEGFQEVFLPQREGSPRDVLLNTGGALFGVLAAAVNQLLGSGRRRRRRRRASGRSSGRGFAV